MNGFDKNRTILRRESNDQLHIFCQYYSYWLGRDHPDNRKPLRGSEFLHYRVCYKQKIALQSAL